MPLDPKLTQLPPPGAKLRLPPKSHLSYEEKYQQVRRHLKDGDGDESTMSVQMKKQVSAVYAQPVRVGKAH